MRAKCAMSLFLLVFFVAGTSWATACDFGCAGSAPHDACSSCGLTQHMATGQMHCSHMANLDSSASVQAERITSSHSHCAHLLCKRAVCVNHPAKALQPRLLKSSVIRHVAVVEICVSLTHSAGRAPPPILTDSIRPIGVALRI